MIFIASALMISLGLSLSCHALSSSDEAKYEALKDLANQTKQLEIDNAKAELKKQVKDKEAYNEFEKEQQRIKDGSISLENVIRRGLMAPIFSVFLFAFVFAFFEKGVLGGILGAVFILLAGPAGGLEDAFTYFYNEYIAIASTQIFVLIFIYKIFFIEVNQYLKTLINLKK